MRATLGRSISICAVGLWTLLVAASGLSAAPAQPELPRVTLTLPSAGVVTGTSRVVPSGGDLQAALNSAAPGDELVLPAGGVWRGNFTLPAKQGTGWVTVRSAALDKLPREGNRVSPADDSALPKIVSPNDKPALAAAPGAHGYRLIGIETTQDSSVPYSYGLVELGNGQEASPAQTPRDIVLDRVYIHGHPQTALKRGITLNSASTSVVNSWISDCHVEGQDAQAIGGFNGPGPFKICNNRLEGSGENLMFGGADPRIPDLVPSDIEIRGNYIFKPLAWKKGDPAFAGKHWTIKNLLELKNARRVLIDGNILEGSWVDGQTGFAILLTVRNQGGTAPWCAVQDVSITNNIIRHSSAGITVSGEDDNHPSQQTQRVLIRNNVLEDINRTRWGGDGRLFQIGSPRRPVVDLVIDHNTALHGGRGNSFITMGDKGKVAQGFVFQNNIVTRGDYGLFGSGKGEGLPSLESYCDGWSVQNNVVIGKPRGAATYPPRNLFPASPQEVGLSGFDRGDYRLDAASSARGSASDHTNPGADCDVVAKATATAVTGLRP